MTTQNPLLSSAQVVATARASLEQDLDETTLLPVFLGRVPAKIQAAIDMIADGTITSEHFFHDHPFRTVFDLATSEQNPQIVSLLDDLIETYKGSLPDLSPFAEGQFRSSEQPEGQLLDDFDILGTVLSACRSNRADSWIKRSATDPKLIARGWGAFAERLKVIRLTQCSALVGATFLRGLDELAALPPSRARAVSASNFASLVHVLDASKQLEAFKRAIQIVLSTPDVDLLRNAASALGRLELRRIASCARYLMRDACRRATEDAYRAVPEAIGKAIGTSGGVVEKWYDTGATAHQLRQLISEESMLNK